MKRKFKRKKRSDNGKTPKKSPRRSPKSPRRSPKSPRRSPKSPRRSRSPKKSPLISSHSIINIFAKFKQDNIYFTCDKNISLKNFVELIINNLKLKYKYDLNKIDKKRIMLHNSGYTNYVSYNNQNMSQNTSQLLNLFDCCTIELKIKKVEIEIDDERNINILNTLFEIIKNEPSKYRDDQKQIIISEASYNMTSVILKNLIQQFQIDNIKSYMNELVFILIDPEFDKVNEKLQFYDILDCDEYQIKIDDFIIRKYILKQPYRLKNKNDTYHQEYFNMFNEFVVPKIENKLASHYVLSIHASVKLNNFIRENNKNFYCLDNYNFAGLGNFY